MAAAVSVARDSRTMNPLKCFCMRTAAPVSSSRCVSASVVFMR